MDNKKCTVQPPPLYHGHLSSTDTFFILADSLYIHSYFILYMYTTATSTKATTTKVYPKLQK